MYPLVLADRLELLVSLPTGLKRVVPTRDLDPGVPVSADELTHEARIFRATLQDPSRQNYLQPAKKLYRWLIQPIEQDLKAHGIKTLVFVPDGPLRTIPIAALHDGEQYLINRYALAVTPGLELTDPDPIHRGTITVLSYGFDRTGSRVQHFQLCQMSKRNSKPLTVFSEARSLGMKSSKFAR